MARIFHDETAQGPGAGKTAPVKDVTFYKAEWLDHIDLPDADFIADADILRDGQNLVLEAPDGTTIIIEGYFSADTPPTLSSPDGAVLTHNLIESFVHHAGPVQYAAAGSANDASPVGAVHEISGNATITRTDGSVETVTIGTPVYQGDVIETDKGAAVNITFIDESTFAVSEHAKLAIDEYVFDPSTESGASNFSLLRGVFVYTSGLIGREDPDDVHIETPIGSIGIRGTTIAGIINPGGNSQITVTEGAIVVRNGSGEMTLSGQFETVRLTGLNDPIQNIGVLDTSQIQQTFNVLRVVTPGFFTAIGADKPADNGESSEPGAAPDAKPAEAGSGNEADATDGENGTAGDGADAATQDDAAADIAVAQDLLAGDISFDGTAENNFDGKTDTFSATTTAVGSLSSTTSSSAAGTVTTSSSGTAASTGGATSGATVIAPVNTAAEPPAPPPSVITPPATPPSGPVILELTTISGADGFIIAGTSGERLGASVAFFGDYDGDSYDDFLLANDKPVSGNAIIYDGSFNVGPLTTGTPGVAETSNALVAGIGDFDGDGVLDYMTSTPDQASFAGQAVIFSSAYGPLDFTNQNIGTSMPDFLGESIAGIGDIDGDGYYDVIAGAPGQDDGGDDSGSAYVIFGNSNAAPYDITALSPQGFAITGLASGDNLGSDVSGAGDFNNDGFADFAIAEPGQSRVHVAFGSYGMTGLTLGSGTLQLNNIDVDATEKEIPILNMGDMNGDGITDIALFSNGYNADGDAALEGRIYVIYGNNSYAGGQTLNVQAMTSTQGFTIGITDPNAVFESGGYAGDFNGDGFDDGVVVLRNGTVADLYVVYGRPTGSNLTDVDLQNPLNAFHMTYNIGHTGSFDFEIATAGDYDGDGFDDIIIGMSDANGGDGAITLVYGRDDDYIGADGNMIHAAGRTTAMPDVIANGAYQHLLGDAGNNTLDMNGFADVSMRGGAGDDLLIVRDVIPGNMDGGTGVDKVELWGPSVTFNYADKGSEYLADIEKFVMMDNNQTLRLSFDSIYQLMQQSQDVYFDGSYNRHVLKIADLTNGDGSGATTLELVRDPAGSPTPFAGSVYGFSSDAGDVVDGGVTFDVYNFGTGYALLIDQNIDTVNLVV